MYINGEEELDFIPGKDAEYNEAADEYSVVLPVETYQPVQTGDAAPVAVYTALLLTAAAALAAAPMLRRRRVK